MIIITAGEVYALSHVYYIIPWYVSWITQKVIAGSGCKFVQELAMAGGTVIHRQCIGYTVIPWTLGFM